jgi:ferritin
MARNSLGRSAQSSCALSRATLDRLNEQIALEQAAADFYLRMSAWCHEQGLEGCASFLSLHSQAERTHMYRLSDYVNENGAKVVVGAAESANGGYASVRELFEDAYEQERHATTKINELLDVTRAEKDQATFDFLTRCAAEQREEEARLERIVAQLRLIGDDRRELFLVDRELAARRLPPKPDGDPT